jgi:hypothetical protein
MLNDEKLTSGNIKWGFIALGLQVQQYFKIFMSSQHCTATFSLPYSSVTFVFNLFWDEFNLENKCLCSPVSVDASS